MKKITVLVLSRCSLAQQKNIKQKYPFPKKTANKLLKKTFVNTFQAFKINDQPLPDPAFIYPPGVVPVSYCFGHPMSLDPKLLPVAPPLPPMPPPVDLIDIPLPTPDPTSYYDIDLGLEIPIPETIPGYVPDWEDEYEAAAVTTPTKKLARPDAAPHLQSVLETGPMTNGFSADPSLWLGKPIETHPHYLIEYDSAPPTQVVHPEYPVSVPGFVSVVQPVSAPAATANGKKSGSEKPEYSVRYFHHLQ